MVNEQPSPAEVGPASPPVDPGQPPIDQSGPPPIDQSALPPLPPGYVWAYPSTSEPESRWKAPRWLVALTVLWAIGLIVSGTIYALRGSPTVREQTTIAQSRPTVNTAIVNVVKAAGPAPIVAIGSFGQSSTCDITPVRPGVEYTQTVDVFVAPGTESTALNTIASGLPPSYGAKAGPGNVLTLYADAGNFVGLVGAVPAPGEIEIKAETGCRQASPAIPETLPPILSSTEMAPVRTILNTIGVLSSSTAAAQVPCTGSGFLRTVTARGPVPTVTTSLAVLLATVAKHPTVSTTNLVAYRTGTTDVVAAKNPTGVTVSATTRCPVQ